MIRIKVSCVSILLSRFNDTVVSRVFLRLALFFPFLGLVAAVAHATGVSHSISVFAYCCVLLSPLCVIAIITHTLCIMLSFRMRTKSTRISIFLDRRCKIYNVGNHSLLLCKFLIVFFQLFFYLL